MAKSVTLALTLALALELGAEAFVVLPSASSHSSALFPPVLPALWRPNGDLKVRTSGWSPSGFLASGLGAGLHRSRSAAISLKRMRETDEANLGLSEGSIGLNSRLGAAAAGFLLSFLVLCQGLAVHADGVSPVLDQARSLRSGEKARLETNLEEFEKKTNYKIRVLTRDQRRQEASLNKDEIKELWGLPDPRAVVVIVNSDRGNVLRFNAGEEVSKLLPQRFFDELTGRLGNTYAVSDEGEDGAILQSVNLIETCLERGGCSTVPGIGKDQYTATMVCSAVGGVTFGFTALVSRKELEKGAKADAVWKLSPILFSPLWGVFLGLGLNPLLARQAESRLILQNLGTFAAAAALIAVVGPLLGQIKDDEPPNDGGGGGRREPEELVLQEIPILPQDGLTGRG